RRRARVGHRPPRGERTVVRGVNGMHERAGRVLAKTGAEELAGRSVHCGLTVEGDPQPQPVQYRVRRAHLRGVGRIPEVPHALPATARDQVAVHGFVADVVVADVHDVRAYPLATDVAVYLVPELVDVHTGRNERTRDLEL